MRQQGQRISEAGSSNAEVADSGVDCRGAAKDCIGAAEEHWTDLRTGLRQRLASCLGQALSRVPSYGSSDGEGENGSSSGSESGHGRGRPLRILSIDGGGIKGVVPALIMEEIERLCAPYHVYELFDLVCGTSTGGILALGTCVARVPVKEMRLVYEKQAKVIWTKRGGAKGLAAGIMGANVGALILDTKYDAANLEALLKEKSSQPLPPGRQAVGSFAAAAAASTKRRLLRMDDDESASPRVFVVSAQEKPGATAEAPFQQYLLRSYRPEVPRMDGSSDCEVWEAARATSAAPLYFDPIELNGRKCVDGGVLHNNPVQVAMDEAADIWPERPVGCIVSIGCGKTPSTEQETTLLGMAKKARDQLTATQPQHMQTIRDFWPATHTHTRSSGGGGSRGGGGGGDGRCEFSAEFGGIAAQPRDRRFRGAFYLRLNPPLPREVELDTTDTKDIALLRSVTERYLREQDVRAQLQRLREFAVPHAGMSAAELVAGCGDHAPPETLYAVESVLEAHRAAAVRRGEDGEALYKHGWRWATHALAMTSELSEADPPRLTQLMRTPPSTPLAEAGLPPELGQQEALCVALAGCRRMLELCQGRGGAVTAAGSPSRPSPPAPARKSSEAPLRSAAGLTPQVVEEDGVEVLLLTMQNTLVANAKLELQWQQWQRQQSRPLRSTPVSDDDDDDDDDDDFEDVNGGGGGAGPRHDDGVSVPSSSDGNESSSDDEEEHSAILASTRGHDDQGASAAAVGGDTHADAVLSVGCQVLSIFVGDSARVLKARQESGQVISASKISYIGRILDNGGITVILGAIRFGLSGQQQQQQQQQEEEGALEHSRSVLLVDACHVLRLLAETSRTAREAISAEAGAVEVVGQVMTLRSCSLSSRLQKTGCCVFHSLAKFLPESAALWRGQQVIVGMVTAIVEAMGAHHADVALQRLSLDTLGFLAKKCEGSSESGDDLTKHDGVLTMAVRIMGWHEADVAVQRAGCVLLLGMLSKKQKKDGRKSRLRKAGVQEVVMAAMKSHPRDKELQQTAKKLVSALGTESNGGSSALAKSGSIRSSSKSTSSASSSSPSPSVGRR